MKKKLLVLFVMIAMVLSFALAGCGGGNTPAGEESSAGAEEEGEEVADTGEVYTVRVAYVVAESHASHIVFENIFKKELEETGRFKVELYPNAQLGGDRQAVEAVSLGNLEMTGPGEAVVSGFVPEWELVGLPFLFTSIEAAREALDGEFGQALDELLLSQNLVNVGWGEVGFRNITNNVRPIKSVDDLKGIKIRTMETPSHITFFRALGANPTPMGFNELFTALQQGTVDGQENPTALTYNSKFYEVQKYMTVSEHVYSAAPFLVNKDFLDSLPEDLRQIFLEVSEKTKDAQRELIGEQNADYLQKMADEGVEVIVLPKEEKEKFQQIAIEKVYPEVIDRIGGDELIKIAQSYNK